MNNRPTLAQLRARVHKDHHREIGNWLARKLARPSAIYGTWLAIRLNLSAHQVTLAALAANLLAALAIGTGARPAFVIGVLLAHLGFWLDHVDGQVARWRGTASLDGVYLDYLMHHASSASLGFALGYGLAARTGHLSWTLAGFSLALGWLGLSLHNDCRYKAFFQRLKRETRSFRVDGGSASRPTAPPPWPRKGLPALTWPLHKANEPHIVLLALTALALLAYPFPQTWLTLYCAGLVLMAALAPLLASARCARALRRNATESEFSQWFQPVDQQSSHEIPSSKHQSLI